MYSSIEKASAAHLESYIDSQATVEHHQRAIQALGSIANSEYLRRVWIVQEFILGKTKTCQIGDTLHSIATFAAAAEVLTQILHKRPYMNNGE